MMDYHNQSIKAIIVEDEKKIGELIKNKVEELDKDFKAVALAENGEIALQLIEEHAPQVVITDISMPIMDGMELARHIRNRYPNVIVVIVSGFSDFKYAQQSIKYGVFNYLLKPLEDEKLLETLYDIKKSLSYYHNKQNRFILYSDNHMVNRSENKIFAIFTVCIGNILYDALDEVLNDYYKKQVDLINWKRIMKMICGEQYDWFLTDESVLNQKVIGIQMKEDEVIDTYEFAQRIQTIIKQNCQLSVNITTLQQAVVQEDMWDYTKRLRNLMKQKLIIGQSKVFRLESNEFFKSDTLEIVKMKLNNYIRNYLLSTDLKNLTDEIQIVLKYMTNNGATQESIEKVCLYILKLLEFSSKGYDDKFIMEMQLEIERQIGLALTEEQLIHSMMESFKKIGSYMNQVYEENLETQIMHYVEENYLTLESLEQVADYFGYNYAYLSRLFKKLSGIPMNKYITGKKIQFAKELMKGNKGMTMLEISEMCGFSDGHYFSRVFKNETGMTPSEYKQKVD